MRRCRFAVAFFVVGIMPAVLPLSLRAQSTSSQAELQAIKTAEDKTEADGADSQAAARPAEVANQSDSHVLISDKAKELGFDPKKLASIDRKLTKLVSDGKVFGCSALIYRKGEEIYFGKWGYQNQRRQIPLDRDTIFRIYSMSKPITSIAAMQLAEQGKLDIDAPVTQYLPEFANLKVLERRNGQSVEVEPKRKMTTRDLLRHTSGLTYGFFGNTPVDQKYRRAGVLVTDLTLRSTVSKLASIPLLHHPATKFHYSASTDVLGRVIEVASEKTFNDYLKANVFQPMDMNDTFFSVPTAKQDRFSQLYKPDSGGKLIPASPLSSIRFVNEANEFYSGGGGLCSTVDDYLTFCKMLLEKGKGGNQQIVKPETLEEMFKNQLGKIENSPGRQFKFGLGFRVFPQGDYGWGGAAGTRFWVHPKKDMAIIFMMQIMPNSGRKYGELVRDAAYAAMR